MNQYSKNESEQDRQEEPQNRLRSMDSLFVFISHDDKEVVNADDAIIDNELNLPKVKFHFEILTANGCIDVPVFTSNELPEEYKPKYKTVCLSAFLNSSVILSANDDTIQTCL